jgi:hypothetical protein
MDERRAGQKQIEAAIGIMVNVRGMTLDTPLTWREDRERDTFTVEAGINGHHCFWTLVGEAVENYVSDLNVGHAVDFNLQSYFLPR